MKSYLIVVLFVCSSIYAEEDDGLYSRIGRTVRAKCSANSENKDAYDEFEQASNQIPRCAGRGKAGGEPPSVLKDLPGWCNFIRSTDIYPCLEDWTELALNCLPKREHFLQNFFLSFVNGSLSQACDSKSKLNELFPLAVQNECFSKRYEIRDTVQKCYPELISVKKAKMGDYSFFKVDVCSDVNTVISCSKQSIEEICEEDHGDILQELFKPFVDWCKINQNA